MTRPGYFPPYWNSDNPRGDDIGLGGKDAWDKNLMAWGINQVPVDNDQDSGVEVNHRDRWMQGVIHNRNYYRKLIFARYHELILNIRNYVNVPVSFNKLKCEWFLRNGNHVAVGKDRLGHFQLLGVVNDTNSNTNPQAPFSTNELTGKDINFWLPSRLIPINLENYKEITEYSDGDEGDFVILRNKPFEYVNDFAIIRYYVDRLAELMASRFSLILQAKTTTVIPVKNGNSEDGDQMINNLINGSPFLLMNENRMQLKNMVTQLGDASIAERIKTLKEDFNDEQNELNNLLGINTTGIDKASGVSDKEVDSNNDYVTSTTNMYVQGVQQGLDLYNAKFHTHYYCYMNQPSIHDLDLDGNLKTAGDN